MLEKLPDENSCRELLENIRWGGKPKCPHCGEEEKHYKLNIPGLYKCYSCRKRFNVKYGTMFEGTHLPLRTWFIAIYIFTTHKKGISSYQLAEDLGITQRSSWFLLHRIRHSLDQPEYNEPLSDTVEADETFVGGKNKNRHIDKKVPKSQGRSYKDKTPVLGIYEREHAEYKERPHKVLKDKTVVEKVVTKESRIICKVIPNTKAKTIEPLMRKYITLGSIVYTDEWGAYKGLSNGYTHEFVDHSVKEYANGDVTTNHVECAWSHLKRTINSTYHKVSRKHLQRYVDEFSYRYNTRRKTKSSRFVNSLMIANKRITYNELIS